jgi:hypothetical protein
VEDATVKFDVDANGQIFPGVGLDGAGLGDEMTLEEDSLGDA